MTLKNKLIADYDAVQAQIAAADAHKIISKRVNSDCLLSVRFCPEQASATVMYRYVLDEDETAEWLCTPFQTANVSDGAAFNTIRYWLETVEDA